MLAATAMGLRLCGIFAQKQKPPAYPHSFHTIPYSMKGLPTATLVSARPGDPLTRLILRRPNTFWRTVAAIVRSPLPSPCSNIPQPPSETSLKRPATSVDGIEIREA